MSLLTDFIAAGLLKVTLGDLVDLPARVHGDPARPAHGEGDRRLTRRDLRARGEDERRLKRPASIGVPTVIRRYEIRW
jgi:hypothetical protein